MIKTIKLYDVATISTGNSAPQDEKLFDNGVHNFVRTSDVGKIHKGIIFKTRDKLNDKGVLKLKKFPKGTILFPKSGASTFLNHRVMLGIDAYVSSHLATIKGDNTKVLDSYLLYFLQTIDAANLVVDSAYPSLKTQTISEIDLVLPSIQEQHHIVSKLDVVFTEIDKMILNTKKSIENAEKFYQQFVNNILNKKKATWKNMNIRDACLFLQGIQVPIKEQSKIQDDTYNAKFLRIIDFTQGNSEPRYIKNESKNKNFSKNDIAIVRYGASTGFVCSGLEGQIANNMFQVIPKDNLFETDYLKFFLNSSIFKNFIKKKIGGAAMPAINFQMFNDFKISFPKNIEERRLLISITNKMLEKKNRLVELYSIKLINLEVFKLAVSSQELNNKAA